MEIKTKVILGILGIVLIGGIAVSLWTNDALKKERAISEQYKQELLRLQLEKEQAYQSIDSLEVVIKYYKKLVDSLDVLVEDNQDQIDWLNFELENALEDISNATPTDAYLQLQATYITTDTNYIYPFSGEQTKLILEDVVSNKYNLDIIGKQKLALALKQSQLYYKDEIITNLGFQVEDFKVLVDDLYKDLAVKEEDLQISEKERVRLKKALRMWQAGSLSAGAGLVLILLLL